MEHLQVYVCIQGLAGIPFAMPGADLLLEVAEGTGTYVRRISAAAMQKVGSLAWRGVPPAVEEGSQETGAARDHGNCRRMSVR